MYETYYNLKAKPFQITTDPRFLWLGAKHSEALATLKYGILENKGFLLLTGDIGTGKTALINRLVAMIDMAAIVATIPDPGLESLDFFNMLSVEFGMNKKFDSKGAFLIDLKNFLHKAYANRKKVLLIIDESQRLNHDLLEQIRLLSNIELDNRKLINIFFVGQNEFNNMLADTRNRAVRQRITVSYNIEPLTEAETGQYVKHRLKIAGASREIFKQDAIREIFAFSKGYPRLINIICDHAMLTGYSSGLKTIEKAVIKECERELQIPVDIGVEDGNGQRPPAIKPPPAEVALKPSIGKRTGVIAALIMLLVLAAYYWLNIDSDKAPRWSMQEIAPQEYKGPVPEEKQVGQDVKPEPGETREVKPVDETPVERNPTVQKPTEAAAEKKTATEEPPARIPQPPPFPGLKTLIYFDFNSNELPDPAFKTLDRIADYLKQTPGARVTIKGYTDSTGSFSYNISVSQFRANTIKTYLTGKGVEPSRITAVGLGPENPIATNETEEGRRKNRRVELELDVKG